MIKRSDDKQFEAYQDDGTTLIGTYGSKREAVDAYKAWKATQ